MRQYQLPGGPYVNETALRQYQIPGGPYINESFLIVDEPVDEPLGPIAIPEIPMSVLVASLRNETLTIDSVTIGPWAKQLRPRATAALASAQAAGKIQLFQVGSDVGGRTVESFEPSTGDTVTIGNSTEMAVFDHGADIAALTVKMPASPYNGQPLSVFFDQAVTALTMNGNGATIKGALTTAADGAYGSWVYSKGANTWYRVG